MPRNKKQEIIYTLMMVIVMVYGMICYNVALNVGGMKNMVFGAALGELPIMGTLAFVVDFFVVGPLAKKFAFRMFQPGKDKMIFVILAISVLSIWMMCPFMSLAATILFKNGLNKEILSICRKSNQIEIRPHCIVIEFSYQPLFLNSQFRVCIEGTIPVQL